MSWLAGITDEIKRHGAVARVTVIRADGSTPSKLAAAMVVSAGGMRDTIGGGALGLPAVGHGGLLLAGDVDSRTREDAAT